MDDSFHCPTCGAPLRIKNRFVKAVTCEFCHNVSLYDGVRLDPTGRTVVEGTSHGDEMCGPVLFYAPHDPKRNAGANIVFLGKWDRRRRAT